MQEKAVQEGKPRAAKMLGLLSRVIPTDYLRTVFYLYVIAKPRKVVRLWLNGFYRMEHVYDVLKEAKENYSGQFSILEFGTNRGYSISKMLYATKFLAMDQRVTVHGFDTFEGMPSSDDQRDMNVVYGDQEWVEGQMQGELQILESYLAKRYSNYELHKGLFSETLEDEFLERLKVEQPILVWIDCDFYTSALSAVERLLPNLPTGCLIYFDEFEFNFGSRFTGEARLVYEINQGKFGDGIELVLDSRLSLNSSRIYRVINVGCESHFQRKVAREYRPGRMPTNGSPLP